MGWSGGNYTKGNNSTGGWVGDASLGIGIEAGRHDTQDDDFAAGINQCLNKDGSNAATGDLNIGGNKVANIAVATSRTDAARYSQVQDSAALWGGTSAGTSTAFTITLSPAITTYVAGQTFRWSAHAAVTGAATINVNGAGAKTLQRQGTALVGNEFKTGDIVEMVYDGTQFQITSIAMGPIYVDRTNNRVGIGTTAPTSTTHIVGQVNNAIGTGTDQTQVFLSDSDSLTSGLLVGYNFQSGVAEYGRIQGRNAGGATDLVLQGGGANVLIGTTTSNSPANLLQVGDATGIKGISVSGGASGTNAGSAATFYNSTNVSGQIGNYSALIGGAYDGRFTLRNAGANFAVVGIQAGVGTHFMKWNNTTSNWTYDTSSARYKDNIEDCLYGLAEVLAMRPVAFTYKAEPSRHDVGFIAEEMLDVVPEIVAKNTKGEPDAISYDRLTSVLCKAIQELNAKIEALEARVAELEEA